MTPEAIHISSRVRLNYQSLVTSVSSSLSYPVHVFEVGTAPRYVSRYEPAENIGCGTYVWSAPQRDLLCSTLRLTLRSIHRARSVRRPSVCCVPSRPNNAHYIIVPSSLSTYHARIRRSLHAMSFFGTGSQNSRHNLQLTHVSR